MAGTQNLITNSTTCYACSRIKLVPYSLIMLQPHFLINEVTVRWHFHFVANPEPEVPGYCNGSQRGSLPFLYT